MKDIIKPVIFNLFFFVAFLVHIVTIGYDMIFPNNPSVRIYEKELREIDFPITFKLCVKDSNDILRYNRMGYSDESRFFYGISKFNRYTYGWNGHTANMSTIGSVQGKSPDLEQNLICKTCSDILRNVSLYWPTILSRVQVRTKSKDKILKEGWQMNWSQVPSSSGSSTCQVLDIHDILNNSSPLIISFYFDHSIEQRNLSVSLNIEDQKKALVKRNLRSHSQDYIGPQIQMKTKLNKKFFMTFSQTLNIESDPGLNCKIYPNSQFKSYRECDEAFIYNEMKNVYKIMPFWAARSLSEVTNNT